MQSFESFNITSFTLGCDMMSQMAQTFKVNTMWNGKSRDVTVTNSGKYSVGNTDYKCVVAALMGHDYHASTKAKGAPTGADGYLHCSATNTLYALKKSDVKSDQDKATSKDENAIAISFNCLGVGNVNKGIHKF